jgi:uncharacterized membrane protein YcaP (DUF421 family)
MDKTLNLPVPWFLAAIGARSVIILVALVAGIRIFGKRDVGGLTLIDLVMVLLLGNAVQNAMTNGSGHIGVGLVSAGALLAIDRLMGLMFTARPWIESKLLGEPTVILTNGQPDERAMRREGVDRDEIMVAARQQGLSDLRQVKLAVLEADGSISVIPDEDEGTGGGGGAKKKA